MPSSGKELYRRFLSLCQKWPTDPTKAGRDYGERLREYLAKQFPHGEQGQVKDPELTEASIEALERISNNKHFNDNPLKRSSATGLDAWACRMAVSNEKLEMVQNYNDQSMIQRLKSTLSVKFDDEPVTSKKINEK